MPKAAPDSNTKEARPEVYAAHRPVLDVASRLSALEERMTALEQGQRRTTGGSPGFGWVKEGETTSEPPESAAGWTTARLAEQVFGIVRTRKDLLRFLDRLAVEYDRDQVVLLEGETDVRLTADRSLADYIRGMLIDPDDTYGMAD